MTNKEKWDLYFRDIGSPQDYIDAGFYFLIASCLRRNVWQGPEHRKLFCNLYMIPTGEAAIGKGDVVRGLNYFLTFWKNRRKQIALEESVDESLIEMMQGKKAKKYDPNLIPMAADATTWQALVDAFVDSYDAPPVGKRPDGKVILNHNCSLVANLEELSSLFKRDTEDLANFFLKAYDCGDYSYDTREHGRQKIKNMCLNFFAGTTPKFIQEVFSDGILSDGFASRAMFLFAEKNRFDLMFSKEHDDDQKMAIKELLIHVRALCGLYGQIDYTTEAYEYLEAWWPAFRKGDIQRPNNSSKLNDYYGRKNVHLKKLAACFHFAEETNIKKPIGLPTVKAAEAWLHKIETPMHLALSVKSVNPLVLPGRHLLRLIANKGVATEKECFAEVWEYLKNQKEDFASLIESYEEMGKIVRDKDAQGRTVFKLVKEIAK